MARLASEHHPEGPGDAPKRRRPRQRRSQTPSVDLSKGSKRPVSPTPETPDTHVKRLKRVQIDDHEQLARELEDSVSRPQASNTINVAPDHESRTRRRFSEPLVSGPTGDDDNTASTPPPATQPLPGLTPHLERLGAPRDRPLKAARHVRMSMPAQLSVDEERDDSNGNHEVQFAPLRAVLDSRLKRRLRRSHLSEEVNEIEEHKKDDVKLRKEAAELRRQLREREQRIRELEFQDEARRMGNIDLSEDQTQALEKELEHARKEIEELKTSSAYAVSSRDASEGMDLDGGAFVDDDEDSLLLVDPDDLNIPQDQMEANPHPNGFYANRASQMTMESVSTQRLEYDFLAQASQSDPTAIPDRVSDQTVKRFELEIAHLNQQVAETQNTFRLLTVELQNLKIVAPGASSDEIITELRHVLDDAREELEDLFPGTTTTLTNGQLLRKMVEHLRGLMSEIREKVIIAEKHNRQETILRSQLNGILTLLAESEDKNTELEQQRLNLNATNEKLQREVVDLGERLTAANDTLDLQDQTIRDNDAKIHGLEDELEDNGITRDRLKQALDTYRNDVDTLTDTVTRLEAEHTNQISKMKQEHSGTVQTLKTQLETEMDGRAVAEGDAQQKAEYIDDLVGRIGNLEGEFTNIDTELARLRQRLTDETADRETAETDRDAQAATVHQLTNEIQFLNESLKTLRADEASLRENLEAERKQRETTEATLDARNDEIDDLNTRIHDAGIQANELRAKLFQNQLEKEQAIAALKDEIKEHDEAHDEALDDETNRRKDAEKEVSLLNKQITGLEKQLADTEDALADMTHSRDALEADRDAQVAQLSRDLDEIQKKFTALESSTKTTIVSLQATMTDLNNELDAAKSKIDTLENIAAATNVEHDNEIAERDATIQDLRDGLENASLEQRVESEANEMLNIMNAHTAEANALNTTISTQQATIINLQKTTADQANKHAKAITEKEQEIEELRAMGDAHMKNAFALAEEDTRNTIDALNESLRQLLGRNEDLAAALKKRNADALEAIREMKVKGLEVKTHSVDLHRTKVTKKKSGQYEEEDEAVPEAAAA
ncbi:uncharacterized protein BDR25DRAFT_331391 [Lindgomyces ingoldianus]|uniref:Uncharacterized protein n=1 Tax=Lindgomyces ingoldianus TaxID=673940 RepID=A0ACB6RC61_9PLEO|nr:uncharacterized protein BDR25DRAFT_331391 [Lindgomyces ingoldianus]KAF2476687.1 hypothetical protein BDR25DRAFT_331391 [Lindgomyces ingoldianus]